MIQNKIDYLLFETFYPALYPHVLVLSFIVMNYLIEIFTLHVPRPTINSQPKPNVTIISI